MSAQHTYLNTEILQQEEELVFVNPATFVLVEHLARNAPEVNRIAETVT